MASEDTCFIGSKTTVRGQVSGKQDLVVEGRIEGHIGLESQLTVEEGGSVEADVEAEVATLRGEVRGPVTALRSARPSRRRPAWRASSRRHRSPSRTARGSRVKSKWMSSCRRA